jgi:SAM-dependent methyltransferase
MTFSVDAESYDAYMGRYSSRLAPPFADFAGIGPGQRVVDVGCGPGALTAELAARAGAAQVAAADPSASFVSACSERLPGVDVRNSAGEQLPWAEDTFDAALAQLVLPFMGDAPAAVREMARVVRRGGTVAACTWDYGGEMQMLRTFWDAARAQRPDAVTEAQASRYGDPDALAGLWRAAGLAGVRTDALTVSAPYEDFDDYWRPFLTGTGPGGRYCVSLSDSDRAALRDECDRRLGRPRRPFMLSARAWTVRGTA